MPETLILFVLCALHHHVQHHRLTLFWAVAALALILPWLTLDAPQAAASTPTASIA